ncbi:MAG: hypothetical protein PVI90_10035 [Desulfobacteraceae bacterium]
MNPQVKTFKVNCPECKKPFHVRFSLANPEALGTGDLRINCMYCSKRVMITIPRKYMEEEEIYREG